MKPDVSTHDTGGALELDLETSDFPAGLSVIEASAGTGKTYSISHLVPRLLIDGTIEHPGQVLLVTFTKDAARELGDRVRRVLVRLASEPEAAELREPSGILARLRARLETDAQARARLGRALLDLDLLAVSTIHAFCQRTLQQEGALCGLPVLPEVVTDDAVELEQQVRAAWLEILPEDGLLAALATVQGWTTEEAARFLKTYRAGRETTLVPPAPGLVRWRAEVSLKLGRLAELLGTGWAEVERVFAGGPPLTKEAAGGWEELRRALEPLKTGDAETTEFWRAVGLAVRLGNCIHGRSKEGKAAKLALAENVWLKAIKELEEQSQSAQWAWHGHLAGIVPARLDALLARRRVITQDGLVAALCEALKREDGGAGTRLAARLAERYRVALVDESQDTDPRQFAIFQRVFLDQADRRLILIGDPKQAIYGFRGADLATYLKARKQAGRTYLLKKTYRSPPPMVAAVNALFQRPGALHHTGLGFVPAESGLAVERTLFWGATEAPRLTVWVARDDEPALKKSRRREREIHERCVDEVVRLLAQGWVRERDLASGVEDAPPRRVRASDIAILTRDNLPARRVAEALEARGVPVILNSGADVFGSEEAAELRLVLRAIHEPRRSAALRRALATRLIGLDAAGVLLLDAPAADGPSRMERWRELFSHWRALWVQRGPAAMFTEMDRPVADLLPEGVARRLAALRPGGERRVTNYRHLTDLLLDAAREQAQQPGDQVRWFGQRVARANDRDAPEEHQIQLASEGDAVRVLTMYKAKGLEYDFVFCPYLAAPLRAVSGVQLFPGEAGGDEVVDLDRAGAPYAERKRAADLEEQLRLAYVALTRARVAAWTCSYTVPARLNAGVSALDWLLRGDEEITNHERCDEAWLELARVKARGGACRHERHEASLRALASACPAVAWTPWPRETRSEWRPGGEAEAGMTAGGLAALPAPMVPAAWQVTSFSRLTRAAHGHAAPSDRADVSAPATAVEIEAPEPMEAMTEAPAFLHSPAGAAVGTAVHDWIENWDFTPIMEPAGRPLEEETELQRHMRLASLPAPGEGQPEWEPALRELFNRLREVRLPGAGGARLAEICPQPHGSEWHFHLPVGGETGLSPRALGECFLRHGPEAYRDYGHELMALEGRAAEGLLQGYIDRLARVGEAWGVIDWKTNRLGAELSAYDEPGLWRCARESHYLLQMHLYLVAVRRWRRALGEERPELAGAWLVFMRALQPGSSRGVLQVQPPEALLDALDGLFAPAAKSCGERGQNPLHR